MCSNRVLHDPMHSNPPHQKTKWKQNLCHPQFLPPPTTLQRSLPICGTAVHALLGWTPSAHCWAWRVSSWGHLLDPSFDFLITLSQGKAPAWTMCALRLVGFVISEFSSPYTSMQHHSGPVWQKVSLVPTFPHAIHITPCAASPQLPPHGGTSQGGRVVANPVSV